MGRRRAIELGIIALLLMAGTAVRMRVAHGWVYAGSDSYAYLALGDEWAAHGRFALAPTEPLEWYRRPLYPLFVHALRAGTGTPGWADWTRIERAQIVLDVWVTGVLVLLVARRLGGRVGGVVALALAMFHPPTVLFSCAVLTEPLMALLTMAMVACLVLGRARPWRWFPVAAVLLALAAYLRPDGPLGAVAFVPALLGVDGWKRRGALAALSLGVFVVAFAPWPARNLHRFGRLHLADGMVDRYGHDVPHYAGYWRWLQTWARDEGPAGASQSCFYNVRCKPMRDVLEAEGAFLAPATNADDERAQVDEALALRDAEGVSQRVSDRFFALARRRTARHRWRVLVALPVERAWRMWSAPGSEPIDNPAWRPWRRVTDRLYPRLRLWSLVLVVAVVVAAAALLVARRTRLAAAILVTTIVARTALLAWSAFCLPRYLVPILPLCFVLVGAAVGLAYARATARQGESG